MTVNPVAPSLPDVQQRAVQLASADWSQVLTTAGDNLDSLVNEISADPFPILTQIGNNLSGYADTISTSLQNSFDGMEKVINGDPGDPVRLPGLEETLQTVSSDLQQGQYFDAFSAYDVFGLEALKFIFKPLAPILGIPDEIVQNVANLSHELFSADLVGDDPIVYENLKEATRALSSPFIGAFFAIAQDAQNHPQDASSLPAEVANAFLNGFTYPGQEEPFAGLLTDDGPLGYLLVSLPQEIAAALGASPPESPNAAAEGSADVMGNLGGDLSGGLIGG
jgi:hypothetical protein